MTEEKLEVPKKTASKRRIAGLVLAVLGLFAVVLWLVRQPIAEAIARGVCGGQKINCQLSITRLDFGGITLTNVDARAPEAGAGALVADEVVVDLVWDNPFSPRASSVSGSGVVLRLDLTGQGPLLGDLDTAITNFMKPSDTPPGPTPRLDFRNVAIIGKTLSGEVKAAATITSTDDSIVVQANAPAASLGMNGATVSLAGADLRAVIAGERISASLKLDLSKFEASGASLADVKIDATIDQDAGVLKGAGSASLGALEAGGAQLRNATATGEIEGAAIDGAMSSLGLWLAQVRTFELNASTGEGSAPGFAWKAANLAARVQPLETGGSGGELNFSADDIRTDQAIAGRFELTGAISVTNGIFGEAKGVARARAVALTGPQRVAVGRALAGPLESVLPTFAEAARLTVDRAAQSFEVTAPWSATAAGAITFAWTDQFELKASSGLVARMTPPAGASEIMTVSTAEGGLWRGAGTLAVSGGGGPTLRLDVKQAEGKGKRVTLEGSLSMPPWKVAAEAAAIELSGLKFNTEGPAGSASGSMAVQLDGRIAGGVWKGVKANSQVSATWIGERFSASAPGGAKVSWTEAVYGDTRFGAASLSYIPDGALAASTGNGIGGRGQVGAFSLPISGGGFDGTARLGAVNIAWQAGDTVKATFAMAPNTVDLKLDKEELSVALESIKGELALSDGWRITGTASGGVVRSAVTVLSGLAGKFDLAGRGDAVSGSLTEVTTGIADPLADAGKRYEDAQFAGAATLSSGVVDFNGRITMAASGIQIAQITGRHSLEDNTGSLSFDRTPLIFARRTFQPYHLSPLLLGPAAVTGRVDVSGAVNWDEDGLKASASLDLRKVGFTLASAGSFEGVSGKIEVADLLNLKSAPGQRLTIDKITLGLPIEKGVIDFQLIGYDAIRLQRAEWPFVGGFIRVKPTDFSFSTTAENQIDAQAVDWNLATLVEQFKIPDLKLQGIVNGEFPVVFSAGSAEIDNAVLASNGPGLIQYAGSATDAVADNEPTTGMVMDALKDFRFEVLKIGLDGNLAGKMVLSLDVLGRNPAVLNGKAFQMNISIDSELAKLVNSLSQGTDVRGALGITSSDAP